MGNKASQKAKNDKVKHKTQENKQASRFNMIILYWIRLNIDGDTAFPLDIVKLIVDVYILKMEFLKFSTEFMSTETMKLSDNDKCVTLKNRNGYRNHILVDDIPATSGIHVWRFKV